MNKRYLIGIALAAACALSSASMEVEAGVYAHAVSVHSVSAAYSSHLVAPEPAAALVAQPSHDVVAPVAFSVTAAPTRIETAAVPALQPLIAAIHPLVIARYSNSQCDELIRPPASCTLCSSRLNRGPVHVTGLFSEKLENHMSYSFSVKAPNKAAAKIAVAVQLAQIVNSQPAHAKDTHQAQAAANAFIDLLVEEPNKSVTVSVSGYLGWNSLVDGDPISQANVAVTASVA